jgi:hypothetical protein
MSLQSFNFPSLDKWAYSGYKRGSFTEKSLHKKSIIGSTYFLKPYFSKEPIIKLNFENKEKDDDSKLAVYDLWSSERIGDAREDEDEGDEDDGSYYRYLYRR